MLFQLSLPLPVVLHARARTHACSTIRPEDTMDDIIPNEVVSKVYRLVPGPASRPEGEPITDFLHNGWNPLNGVADP